MDEPSDPAMPEAALLDGALLDGALLDAAFYVALHRGTAGDVDYYRRAALGARSLLELGAGDGRVLLGLVDASRSRLLGLDHHPGMIELARRRASLAVASGPSPEFSLGDITDFRLEQRFERILLPYSTLWCLSDEGKLACLRAAAAHASAGAELHFDVYDADDSFDEAEPPWVDEREFVVELEVLGQRYRVFEQDRGYPAEGRLEAHFEFVASETRAGRGLPVRHEQHIVHHPLRSAELAELLLAAGWRMHDLCAASGAEYDPDRSEQYFVRATRRT